MKILLFLLFSFLTISVNSTEIHSHSIELLGKKKSKQLTSKKKNINKFIDKVLAKRLPKKYKNQVVSIRKTIVSNSNKYNLDPLFILAVIDGESSFNPKAPGPVGEIGLMQLRDSTAKWLSEEYLKKPYKGKKSLENPHENIRIGTNYIRFLRSRYKKDNHYISAYNLGPKQLKEALKKNVIPKDYKKHVMKRYISYIKSK